MVGAAGAKILVVDDDDVVRGVTAAALAAGGYRVLRAASGMEAFAVLADEPLDLVVLDVVMPAISGLEVLEHVRHHHPSLPVILLSALGADENVVRGLRLGAEDYVVKPVSPAVLLARVERALRGRTAGGTGEVLHHGALTVDLATRQVHLGAREIEMTAREFDLLAFLVRNAGRVYTRRQLLAEVWQSSPEWQQEATVTEHVRRLRTKIEPDPAAPVRLQTIRGVGYRFSRERETAVDGAVERRRAR